LQRQILWHENLGPTLEFGLGCVSCFGQEDFGKETQAKAYKMLVHWTEAAPLFCY
jgi:hypothetical protein